MVNGSGECTEVRLDLVPGVEPVQGTLSANGSEPMAFAGWIELIEALESWRLGDAGPAPPGRAEVGP